MSDNLPPRKADFATETEVKKEVPGAAQTGVICSQTENPDSKARFQAKCIIDVAKLPRGDKKN